MMRAKEQNRLHRRPVGNARVVAPQWVGLSRRQQRLHALPQGLTDVPAIIFADQSHGYLLLIGLRGQHFLKNHLLLE